MPASLARIVQDGALALISLYFALMSPAMPPSSAVFGLKVDPNEVFTRIVNEGGISTDAL